MKSIITLMVLFSISITFGQVKIGDNINTIDATSIMELESASKVFVVTRVTTIQMNGITPLNGALVYNTDDDCLFQFNNGSWSSLCVNVSAGETVTTLIDNGNGTFTYTNEAGTDITISQASLQNNGDGTYSFMNSGGSITIIDTNAVSNNYNNGASGLTATTVQDAIDELKTITDTAIAGADDDISGVTFDGTDLTVEEGTTTFSADLSALEESADITANATAIANEVTRATAVEAAIQADVDTNEADADAAIAAVQADVDTNEADADAAIALKEDTANKSTDTALGTSDVLFPSQNAVKTYVDGQITATADDDITDMTFDGTDLTVEEGATSFSANLSTLEESADITANTNAIALKEDAANKSTDVALGASDLLFPTQNAVKTYVDAQITATADDDITALTFDGADLTVNEGTTSFSADLTALEESADITANTNAIALKEDTANKSTDGALGTSDVLFPTQNAVKTYVDAEVASFEITDVIDGHLIALVTEADGTLVEIDETITGLASPTGAESTLVYSDETGGTTTIPNIVRSVNGVNPAANGNVAVVLSSVSTGLEADLPATGIDADVYIVSGEVAPNTDRNGVAFIYDDPTGWQEVTTDLATADARYVNSIGDNMTGPLAMGNNGITGVNDPVNAQDVATKNYVDGLAAGTISATDLTVTGGANATFGNVTLAIADDAVDRTKINPNIAGTGLIQATDGSLEIDPTTAIGDGDISSSTLTVGGETDALLGDVTLEIAPGANDQVLTTNSSGNVAWVDSSTLDYTGTTGSVFFAGAAGNITENNGQLFWDSTNNRLGIGTDSPTHKLQVTGQVRATSFANADGTATAPSYRFNNDGNTGMFRAATDQLGFSTAGAEALRIDTSGNIGIGTTTPDEALQVAGNMRLDGSFEDKDGDPGTAGQVLSSTATGTDWVDASGVGTDSQGLSNAVVTPNESVEIQISGGSNTTINIQDADSNATNELTDLSLSGSTLTLTNPATGSNSVTLPSADGTETLVTAGSNISVSGTGATGDAYVIANTFTEVDGSITNELTDLNLSGNVLTLTNPATGSNSVTLPSADGTETLVTAGSNISVSGTGATGDAYVIANTFTEVDGSITNELTDLNLSGDVLTLTNPATGSNSVTLPSADGSETLITAGTDISVSGTGITGDAYVIESTFTEVDGSVTNELTDLNLSGNVLTLTNPATGSNSVTLPSTSETTTNLNQDTSTGIITYSNEASASQTANVVGAETDNSITSGANGGAYFESPIKAFGKISAAGGLTRVTPGITITKLGTGRYRVNLPTGLVSDANYIIQLSQPGRGGSGNDDPGISYNTQTATSFEVITGDNDNGGTDRSRYDSEFMFTILDL